MADKRRVKIIEVWSNGDITIKDRTNGIKFPSAQQTKENTNLSKTIGNNLFKYTFVEDDLIKVEIQRGKYSGCVVYNNNKVLDDEIKNRFGSIKNFKLFLTWAKRPEVISKLADQVSAKRDEQFINKILSKI